MIVTRTPFRITLGGGGTDLPSYYEKHGGFIFAMGLNKYMYVCLNRPVSDNKLRLHYTRSEEVDHVSELKHELAREALKHYGVERGVEISSLADIPAGTGVGSSSCYLVGLLNAVSAFKRQYRPLEQHAEDACRIELEILKKGIGKQDQYMAAFGGFTVLDIEKSGKVNVRSVELGESAIAELVGHMHIYNTGLRRDAPEVLQDQNKALQEKQHPKSSVVEDSLNFIKDLGHRILDQIEHQEFDQFGLSLHEHWEKKKKMSEKISSSKWDEIYDEVRKGYNVLGGKIIGAGGGGFLMLYCNKNPRRLEEYMTNLGMPRVHYGVDREGTKVMAHMMG
jgi:D-glycero-alpha-D-manno-heptose-7-phosphate kinase